MMFNIGIHEWVNNIWRMVMCFSERCQIYVLNKIVLHERHGTKFVLHIINHGSRITNQISCVTNRKLEIVNRNSWIAKRKSKFVYRKLQITNRGSQIRNISFETKLWTGWTNIRLFDERKAKFESEGFFMNKCVKAIDYCGSNQSL